MATDLYLGEDMLRMSEAITLDDRGEFSVQGMRQRDLILSTISIGRIYRSDNTIGTCFVVALIPDGALVMTCKHFYQDPLIHQEFKSFIVCFDKNQHNCSYFDEDGDKDEDEDEEDKDEHNCGTFYQLEVLTNDFKNSECETDPCTLEKYSFNTDLAIFRIRNQCSCGSICALPELVPLELMSNVPKNEFSYVIGFPGPCTKDAFALKNISDRKYREKCQEIFEGVLTQSEERVLKIDNSLAATSCSTWMDFQDLQ